jgi:hypothetical protein
MDDTNVPLDDITTSTDTPVVVEEMPAVFEDTPLMVQEVSPYITTIDELVSIREAVIQKEQKDRTALHSMFQPDGAILKTQLIEWASRGFLSNHVVFTSQIDPPSICSDGQTRGFYDYAIYLLGSQIQPFLDLLNSQVLGVSFNFFLRDTNTIGMNVTKA